jgi:hypothetical protein
MKYKIEIILQHYTQQEEFKFKNYLQENSLK